MWASTMPDDQDRFYMRYDDEGEGRSLPLSTTGETRI